MQVISFRSFRSACKVLKKTKQIYIQSLFALYKRRNNFSHLISWICTAFLLFTFFNWNRLLNSLFEICLTLWPPMHKNLKKWMIILCTKAEIQKPYALWHFVMWPSVRLPGVIIQTFFNCIDNDQTKAM